MTIQQMQQQLMERVSTIEDEDILTALSEALSYFVKSKLDLKGVLDEADLKELATLANEPMHKNTMSLNEFNRIMEHWCIKK